MQTLNKPPHFYTISERDRIVHQQDRSAKDIIQPWIGDNPNPDFVRAYPELHGDYFTPDQIKDI